MKIIVITGAPGVGKTETGRALINLFEAKAAWIDTDALASIQPFIINDEFYKLAGDNLKACIKNYYSWGIQNLIISGVVIPNGIYEQLSEIQSDDRFRWKYYFLKADPQVIKKRVLSDSKPQNANQRLEWLHVNNMNFEIPNCRVTDNSQKSISNVALEIFEIEKNDISIN